MRSSVLFGSVLAVASALAMCNCGGASSSGVTPSPSTPAPGGANIVVNIASSAGASAYIVKGEFDQGQLLQNIRELIG